MVDQGTESNVVTPEDIASFILDETKKSTEVLGSDLGIAIIQRFPIINFKKHFGPLRVFIEKYCGDQILWIRKHGSHDAVAKGQGDDVYVNKANLTHVHSTIEEVDGYSDVIPYTSWQIFTHPSDNYYLVVNRDFGGISARHSKEDVPYGCLRINSVTAEEHKQIATSFLPQVDERFRPDLEECLKKENYWPDWMLAVKKLKSNGVQSQWYQWRTQEIIRIFESRLRSIGVGHVIFPVVCLCKIVCLSCWFLL